MNTKNEVSWNEDLKWLIITGIWLWIAKLMKKILFRIIIELHRLNVKVFGLNCFFMENVALRFLQARDLDIQR